VSSGGPGGSARGGSFSDSIAGGSQSSQKSLPSIPSFLLQERHGWLKGGGCQVEGGSREEGRCGGEGRGAPKRGGECVFLVVSVLVRPDYLLEGCWTMEGLTKKVASLTRRSGDWKKRGFFMKKFFLVTS